MNKKNALICIAAGKSQLLVIEKAIELGFSVIAIDINPKAIGFEKSTEKIICSTYDSGKIIQELKKFSNNYLFCGILNRSSGIPVITVSEISEYFKIESYPKKSAETILNKHLFFKYLRKTGLSVPNFQIVNSITQNTSLNFPIIIKPSLSMIGKSGIIKVNNNLELNKNLTSVFNSSDNDNIIIQEFIEGIDIAMVSFVQNNKLYPLAFIEEINKLNNQNKVFGCGVMAPARIVKEIENKIIDYSNRIISDLEIHTSPFMISFRISNEKLYIIEVHLDFGGDLILEELLPNYTNIDITGIGVKLLAGDNLNIPLNYKTHPTAIIYHPGLDLNSNRKHSLIHEKNKNELMISFNKKYEELYK